MKYVMYMKCNGVLFGQSNGTVCLREGRGVYLELICIVFPKIETWWQKSMAWVMFCYMEAVWM